MKRLPLAALALLLTVGGLASCGSDSVTDTVCGATGDALFSKCDQSDAGDQQLIVDAFADFGITITTGDVEAATQAEFVTECTTVVATDPPTDEEAAQYTAALNETSTCQEVITVIDLTVGQSG